MAWKNFQNGYPLYASELNNYLMNQSVATFASSTERASVLTSPVEGQVTWLQDTNAFQVYNGSAWVDINDNTDAIQKSLLTTAGDTIYATGSATPARLALGSTGSLLKSNGTAPTWLGVGTSGQVLGSTGTDVAWTTVATSSITLLSTTSLSGASTTVSSINQTYKHLYVEIQDMAISTTATLRLTLGGNTDAFWANAYFIESSSGGVQGGSGLITPGDNLLGGNYEHLVVSKLTVYDYTSATSPKMFEWQGHHPNSTPKRINYNISGTWIPSTALNSITLALSTGTFSAGTIKVYGVK